MGLIELLDKKFDKILFTTPSHGDKLYIYDLLKELYKVDISETETHNPQLALLESEKWASEIYDTVATAYLTNGATSGIIAAVLACTGIGDRVLIASNAHPSHYNAIRLAGARGLVYNLDIDKEWGVHLETRPEVIEYYLSRYNIKAVIVTSPTYEGIISDIEEIKDVCSKYGAYLIVDEAHGALYPFSDNLPLSAVNIADFTVQSLHKTAGGLNPTALLHTTTDFNIKSALSFFMTTSPSYPLLASIEANILYLNSKEGRKEIDKLIKRLDKLREKCDNCDFYGDDPTKILVKIPGMSGYELSEILYNDFNIEDEITNEKSTMLLCGIGTDNKKIDRLEKALRRI